MRVGLVAPPWLPVPPTGYGATERIIDNLARGLDEAGHDVMLCASADSTCAVNRAESQMQSTGIPNMSPKHEICHAADSYAQLREWGADIVHDHTMTGPMLAHDMPVVATNHVLFDDEMDCYYQRVVPHVPVIAISHHQRLTAARGVNVVRVIHHGIDVDQCPVGQGDGGYALFIGRFDPAKGVDLAVMVALVAGVPLKIVAREPLADEVPYFRDVIEPLLKSSTDIEWVGETPTAEKSELIAGAVCLVNPITWPEPFGIVMIEALAHGTPVVASPLGSVPEIVNHGVTGYVFDPGESVVGVKHCVEGRIDRSACRKAAEDRFSTWRMVARHVELYERVIADPEDVT